MPKGAGRKPKLQFKVDPDKFDRVERFCAATRRDIPHTLRAVIDLFFADGDDVANDRLSQGLWDQTGLPPEDAREIEKLLAQLRKVAVEAALKAGEVAPPAKKAKSG